MAITKLTELETAVADRLARADFTTSQIDECIAFAEAIAIYALVVALLLKFVA